MRLIVAPNGQVRCTLLYYVRQAFNARQIHRKLYLKLKGNDNALVDCIFGSFIPIINRQLNNSICSVKPVKPEKQIQHGEEAHHQKALRKNKTMISKISQDIVSTWNYVVCGRTGDITMFKVYIIISQYRFGQLRIRIYSYVTTSVTN